MLIKNFKIIMNIYKNMSRDDHPVMLGRWYIDYTKDVKRKIDLANEDHCGVCNQYEKNINTQLLVPLRGEHSSLLEGWSSQERPVLKQIATQLLISKKIPSELIILKQVPTQLLISKKIPSELIILKQVPTQLLITKQNVKHSLKISVF
jgi:hypothetical protein